MSKALLVIDMQEAYVGERCASYLKIRQAALLRAVNDVIDACSGEGCMVVYVRNVTKRSLIKRLALSKVYEGTPESELVEGLHVMSDHVFVKYVGDALSNPELRVFLKQNGRLRGADRVGRNRKRLPCGCRRAGHRHDVRTQQSEVFQKTTKTGRRIHLTAASRARGYFPFAKCFSAVRRFAGMREALVW